MPSDQLTCGYMTNAIMNAIFAYSTLAIAVLTFFYVKISRDTLRKIGKQAELAEAANAAFLN